MKRQSVEKDKIAPNQLLNAYIQSKIEAFENYLNDFNFQKKLDSSILNELFITELNRG